MTLWWILDQLHLESRYTKERHNFNVSKDLGLTGGTNGRAHSEGTSLVSFIHILFNYYSVRASRCTAFTRVFSPLHQAYKNPYLQTLGTRIPGDPTFILVTFSPLSFHRWQEQGKLVLQDSFPEPWALPPKSWVLLPYLHINFKISFRIQFTMPPVSMRPSLTA